MARRPNGMKDWRDRLRSAYGNGNGNNRPGNNGGGGGNGGSGNGGGGRNQHSGGRPNPGNGGGGQNPGQTPGGPPDIYDLSTQLSDPQVVRRLVNQVLRGQYKPALDQARRNVQQVGGYYDDYRTRLQQLNQGQQAYTGQLLGQLGQFGQQIGAAAPTAMPNMTGGAHTSPQAAQAQQVRAGMLGNMGGLAANQALAQSNYTANRAAASTPMEIAAKLAAKQVVKDLKLERGSAKADLLNELRGQYASEKEARFNRRIIRKEFGLNVANAANDAADAARDDERAEREARRERRQDRRENRQERRQDNNEVNEYGVTNKVWRTLSYEQRRQIIKDHKNLDDDPDNGGGDDGGGDRGERREERREGRKARIDIATLFNRYKNGKIGDVPILEAPNGMALLQEKIAEESDYSPAEIKIGVILARGGRLSPKEFRQAKTLGIPVPKHQRPVRVNVDVNDNYGP